MRIGFAVAFVLVLVSVDGSSTAPLTGEAGIRSATITGPYVDRDWKPMISGGGSELLATHGVEVGPGGEDMLGVGTLAYHYYDARDNGSPKLAVRSVRYANGWPVLGSIR